MDMRSRCDGDDRGNDKVGLGQCLDAVVKAEPAAGAVQDNDQRQLRRDTKWRLREAKV
jgi:hypothetical protein